MDALENIGIEQLNLGYHADQDRLLLRAGLSNQSEVAVWISYRVAKVIWQGLSGQVSSPEKVMQRSHSTLVESFKHEVQMQETLNRLDFQTPYVQRKATHDVGALLVKEAKLVVTDGGSPTLVMDTVEGMQVCINLNPEMSLAMINMLQLACKEAEWPLVGNAVNSQLLALTDPMNKQVLH